MYHSQLPLTPRHNEQNNNQTLSLVQYGLVLNLKPRKSKRNENNDFDSGKLKNLKKQNKLSNMFSEGDMLDYYDLSTERGRRAKKKPQKNEKRNKQKIFKLTEITIPETITGKDRAGDGRNS